MDAPKPTPAAIWYTAKKRRMNDLRLLIENINRKYDARPLPPPRRMPVEEFLPGEEIETAFGRHYRNGKIVGTSSPSWQRRYRRARLRCRTMFSQRSAKCPLAPRKTGLFSIPRPPAFRARSAPARSLVGVGRITKEGFRVRQFFMRGYGEEASLLDSLARHLKQFQSADHLQRRGLRSAAARIALSPESRAVAVFAAASSRSAARRAPPVEIALRQLPSGGPRKSGPRLRAPGRYSRRDDPLCLFRIPAHEMD